MILVTGANGFVGAEVCRELVRRGRTVRAGVRRPEAVPPGCQPAVIGDIGPGTDWSGALRGVEAVVHLAARAHITDEKAADPDAAFRETNVLGTRRLAEAAVKGSVKRFLLLSSVKVNGEANRVPFTEADQPAPRDAYGRSKWEAEQALRQTAAGTGLAVTILRSPLIYGPGVKANFLSLVRMVDQGRPLPFGRVRNLRSLLGLANLADLIDRSLGHPAAAGRTYLAGDGEDVSTRELVRRIGAALGRPARLLPLPVWTLRMGGRLLGRSAQIEKLAGSLRVDASLLKRELGWDPPSTMEKELERIALWYKGIAASEARP